MYCRDNTVIKISKIKKNIYIDKNDYITLFINFHP